ncbi:hypothetical protein [uncultured Methanoregula sp.]|uniref:hypothetical protein n=1 Tax=uncultured Methanoregula sp. TaxID=1005933 RepID=UPI002AABAD41|nr:hypothetical protein [uncultured Methanoregula sp.]
MSSPGMVILFAVMVFIAGCTTAPPARAAGPATNGSPVIVVDALLPLMGSDPATAPGLVREVHADGREDIATYP